MMQPLFHCRNVETDTTHDDHILCKDHSARQALLIVMGQALLKQGSGRL